MESERTTAVLSTHELLTYIGLTIGLILRNCNVSCQCDNGLIGDSGNLLCTATSVMQVCRCKQNSRIRYFCGYSLPRKYNTAKK